MGSQWGRDRVYVRALKEGYRSRAAFKLLEIQERHHIIRDSDNVVDLGAAPGSWLQVIREITAGTVVGVDISYMPPLEGVTLLCGDFTGEEVLQEVIAVIPQAGVVVSDAAPKLSGQRSYDQARSIELGEQALRFATKILKPGGNFIVKSFQGQDFNSLLTDIKGYFLSVRTYRPQATRRGSTEIYIVAKNFIGRKMAEFPVDAEDNETQGRV
jgi:23S rRNA (uridine2552-2'-O)-methyltransferase